jgi:hypothetical protein
MAPGTSAPTPPAPANTSAVEAPPADAQFTLYCTHIPGANHVIVATALRDDLVQKTGMRGWHIVHANDQSTIYFGYYRTFDDRQNDLAETERAQADLKRIEALKNSQGERLFPRAVFLPVNNADPDAPAEWNLVNTPRSAYWSLQIAAYEGSPERKHDAVEMVREFRKRGVEAYYFHGETISSVCIGAWPENAIKRQDMKSAHTANPDDRFIVTNQPLPPNVSPEIKDRDGKKVIIEAPKLEFLDPTMADAIRRYPNHAVNGFDRERTARNGAKVRDPSFLVLIPHSDTPQPPAIELRQPKETLTNGAAAAANSILDDAKPTQSDRGQLRGVEQP